MDRLLPTLHNPHNDNVLPTRAKPRVDKLEPNLKKSKIETKEANRTMPYTLNVDPYLSAALKDTADPIFT
jgi:hypothetical protein